ncbi:prolipoprotein diacylglyceryl transferase [Mycoplasmopsis canis UFG4]|uniref:Phosphatidylglycerol--prolipoprotein diacylglyceryl transferase n=2 Tax=Mycoplasmopsis canis TaxID=29555 RepID=I1A4E8_9BACT|nr:prolipoprotein diacylglyceryl transferase [Mycoplasmopsis canis]AMD81554.1 prolipoprotein diacylglyceryl transferase [Mycoplasmopsis canis PG 14]EIE39428.1 prolipoprotein diacylglyceryl transferase [Mycoplasmopsis canis PG 14]EIE41217.1 prolipoprotein diacylglyceryl transferase [Mycoplasmopsis canis UFG1]EIE41369.1 prolipoprotein diacylglyceryl transferase [Mycoplasmopsis canis UFG4]VEU69187.1 Prolipoprotein diacylglyceryl transferase [Mycoplasmopsis canis]
MNNLNGPSYVPDVAFRAGTPSILFNIGSFQLHTYSLMILSGYLASILTIFFFWRREKMNMDVLFGLILITIPMGIIGSRLGFVFEELIYSSDPFRGSAWYALWDGGLSIQGGVFFTIVADMTYVYTKRNVIDIRKATSIIIPTILVGQFIGRFGNYGNHEVYGKIDWSGNSSIFWGKSFADNMYISDSVTDALGLEGAYRYPLFLYEGLANLVGYLIIVWIFNLFWTFKPGATAGLYLLWYGILRLALEPLRQESFLYYSIIALAFAIVGGFIFIYFAFWSKVKYVTTVKNKVFKHYEYKYPEYYSAYVNRSSFSFLFKKTLTYTWFK